MTVGKTKEERNQVNDELRSMMAKAAGAIAGAPNTMGIPAQDVEAMVDDAENMEDFEVSVPKKRKPRKKKVQKLDEEIFLGLDGKPADRERIILIFRGPSVNGKQNAELVMTSERLRRRRVAEIQQERKDKGLEPWGLTKEKAKALYERRQKETGLENPITGTKTDDELARESV